jgi:protein-S-isoprenylcysteine O-methyltransferase Ste14
MRKFRDFSGQLIMACFGLIAIARFAEVGLWFFLLMAFRDFYASYLFSRRRRVIAHSAPIMTIVAYASSALPLFYLSAETGMPIVLGTAVTLLSIIGFTLVGLATIDLGTSIGVTPALRGSRRKRGVYRMLNHPMYTGYLIAEMGLVIANHENLPIFGISIALYLWRATAENQILAENA